jgi:hypothetical protein
MRSMRGMVLSGVYLAGLVRRMVRSACGGADAGHNVACTSIYAPDAHPTHERRRG